MAVGFETLLVLVAAGLAGPLLSAGLRSFVPVVVGELAAGVIVGPSVSGAIDPTSPALTALAAVGFAMLMLSAGMHLPLRDHRLAPALGTGAALAAIVCVLAFPAGFLSAAIAGGGHTAVYVVLLASGSAAVLMPALEELDLESAPAVMPVIAQVAIADVITIVSVPLVLRPSHASHALLGALLVAAVAGALLLLDERLAGRDWVHRLRMLSKRRHWALDLRLSLLVLFLLAWLAVESGTSVLIAGFGAGMLVAAAGGPKRLSTQMRGIAEGFFIPLYFVVLGARLDLGGLFSSVSLIALAAALLVLGVAIRLIAAVLMRRPPAGGLAASAQLGVPAAIASLGLADGVLTSPVATAIIVSALGTLAVCSVGITRLARGADGSDGEAGRA